MSVNFLQEDLIKSKAQTIVCPTNCLGIVDNKIFKYLIEKEPKLQTNYSSLCASRKIGLGVLWVYRTPNQNILCFPNKVYPGPSYDKTGIEKGLIKFVNTYQKLGITSAAFPLLGKEPSDLIRELLKELMVKHLSKCKIPIYIYENMCNE